MLIANERKNEENVEHNSASIHQRRQVNVFFAHVNVNILKQSNQRSFVLW